MSKPWRDLFTSHYPDSSKALLPGGRFEPTSGPLKRDVTTQAKASTIFGAPLSATFRTTPALMDAVAIRRMPAPGSLAETALEARRLKSGKEHKKLTVPGLSHDPEPDEVQATPTAETKPKSGQRQQPKRKKRVKPAGQGDSKAGPNQRQGQPQKPRAGQKPVTDRCQLRTDT
ncbi:MAG: hypothetical protein ABIP19_02760 [Dermatophilaceae bacterium]